MAGTESAADSPQRRPLPSSLTRWHGFLLARAHLRAQAIFLAALSPARLTPKGYGALATLAETGPVSQAALGETMRIDRTTVVAVIDELEQEGLVERRRNPADRRVYSLELTEAGRSALEQAEGAAERAHAELLAALSDDERETLHGLLERIVGGPAAS